MQILYKVSNKTYLLPKNPHPQAHQIRHRKPRNTAQTRLENRTLDVHFDKLSDNLKRLTLILNLHKLIQKRKRGPYISLQITSRWKNILGLTNVTPFIKKHPHVFDVFTHPVSRVPSCRLCARWVRLVEAEERVVRETVGDGIRRVKKLVMMSRDGGVGLKGVVLVRRELGLPVDWKELVEGVRVVGDRVELVEWEEKLAREVVEDWREKEWREKWLSEFEVRFAFPVGFPTGFRMGPGFRGKLRDWQRLPYLKLYERAEGKVRRNDVRYEKRAVAVVHEILSLMVEKKVELERLSHFRKDLGFEVNIRELLVKHPGIFYISTKGGKQTVFLREAYRKGCLVESNPVYEVRRKMLDHVLLGRRNTRVLKVQREVESGDDFSCVEGEREGQLICPLLDSFENRKKKDELFREGNG